MSSKIADRLTRIEELFEEAVQLLRVIALRGDSDDSPDAPFAPLPPSPLPVLPAEPWPVPTLPIPTLPDVPSIDKGTTCGRCGVNFRGVTGYVCNQPDCPMGLGPVTCES